MRIIDCPQGGWLRTALSEAGLLEVVDNVVDTSSDHSTIRLPEVNR